MKETRASFGNKLWDRLKKLTWKNLRSFSWWLKLAGAIGSVGAFISIFFLWCNLREIKKQTQLEYKGFLAVQIDSIKFTPQSEKLIVWLHPEQTSRVPLLVSPYKDVMISQDEDINFDDWIEEIKRDCDSSDNHLMPLVYEKPMKVEYQKKYILQKLDSILYSIPVEERKGKAQSLHFHVILKYRDLLEKEYWVYMCWELIRICEGIKGSHMFFNYSWLDKEYEVWGAKPNEKYPMELPPHLKEITARATQKDKAKL